MDRLTKPLLYTLAIAITLLVGVQLGIWKGRKLQRLEDERRCMQRLMGYESKHSYMQGMIEAYEAAFDYKTVMEELGVWEKGGKR